MVWIDLLILCVTVLSDKIINISRLLHKRSKCITRSEASTYRDLIMCAVLMDINEYGEKVLE